MILFVIAVLLASLAMYVAYKGGLSNVARERKYKSGTGWCAWRWTDVESEYILRLHVFKTPWFAVCLHWIRKPDRDPWLHDHPVSFLSLILRGGYAELRAKDGDVEHRVHKWYNVVRASRTDRHRIVFCRKNTLTLCLMGPKTQEWGFYTPEGWIYWKTYYARLKAGENMRREPWSPGPEGWIAAFERECGGVLDAMALRVALTGTPVDEEKRTIDTAPAEPFVAEEPTEKHKLGYVGGRSQDDER